MIKVKKDFKNIPYSLKDENAEKKIEKILLYPGLAKKAFKPQEDVKERLRIIYNNKCAYCESQLSLEVEHYRPKGGLSGVKNHKGYYWVTFEWSNLLYVCSECNRAKQHRFPIADDGVRIYLPQSDRRQWDVKSKSFRAEKPFLLNPEIDSPEEYLEFLVNGRIKAKNGSMRGKKTIEICKLNRKPLRLYRRKKIIDDLFRRIKLQITLLFHILKKQERLEKKDLYRLAFETIFIEIKEGQGPQKEFSRVYFYMYEKFEDFLDSHPEMNILSNLRKKIVKEAFKFFKEGNL
jgi:uncharacterized protein (TIGR02646 family)